MLNLVNFNLKETNYFYHSKVQIVLSMIEIKNTKLDKCLQIKIHALAHR